MPSRPQSFVLIVALATLLATTLLACSTSVQAASAPLMPMDKLPAAVQSAPMIVRTAYQFAAVNPEVMKQIPCYCGCGNIGHTSNYSCYVSHADQQGTITFDNHALGCSVCVDITQDAMRLLREGKTVPQIRAYVDATYSKYGTSNMP